MHFWEPRLALTASQLYPYDMKMFRGPRENRKWEYVN